MSALSILMLLLALSAFAGMVVATRVVAQRHHQGFHRDSSIHAIMQQALLNSANNVVRFDLHDRYVYQLFGHLFPDKGMTTDEWIAHIHPDDRQRVLTDLRSMMSGKSQRTEFSCRWNSNYGEGEPQWAYLHNLSIAEYDPDSERLRSIIGTLKDETEQHRQELEEQQLTSKYRLIFEESLIALSFYDADGWLLDSNANMRQLCHFDSEDGDSFFSHTNLFDLFPFNEVCNRDNLEEFWGCCESVVPERNMRDYLEIRLHPIRDDEGRLTYIAISARNVSEERDLYLQARQNDLRIMQANREIQHYETELRYLMENNEMQAWRISLDRGVLEFYAGLDQVVRSFQLADLPRIFVDQEAPFVKALANPAEGISHPLSYIGLMNPIVTLRQTEQQWVQINSIPEFDDRGRLLGAFGIWRNVNAQMRRGEQLRRETERANDSGRLKSVFLANMTHEIRTPLNAIVGFSDLLQAIDQPDEKREMIRIIHNNCDMLLRLIDDILVLSNVDANAMQMQVEEVDFSPLFDDICQSLAQRVENPAVEFQKDNPLASLRVRIDKDRLQQVITNFVTNAVKYTQQGHIRVGYRLMPAGELPPSDTSATASAEQNGLYVYCEDTGSGIPEDQRERVFERFVKLNDYIQGTGLGLSICKAIISKCGGRIGVESQEGQGSTFWFWIPV